MMKLGLDAVEEVVHAVLLALGELLVAGVVAVVHVVMDRVDASLWAGVLARGAAAGDLALSRGIGNEVTFGRAILILEDVEETEPMTGLVGGSAAKVVVVVLAARHGVAVDVAAVEPVLTLRPVLVRERADAKAEQTFLRLPG